MTHAHIQAPDFFTADWHIGHINILKYDRRPLRNVDEMAAVIVGHYNYMVRPESHVVFLGDMFFRGPKDGARSIMDYLFGRKTLILGNHDRHSKSWYRDIGFESVLDSATITDEVLGDVTLVHNPLHAIGQIHSNYIIHGHKHSVTPKSDVGDVRRVDVGIVAWGYYPAPCAKVIEMLRAF